MSLQSILATRFTNYSQNPLAIASYCFWILSDFLKNRMSAIMPSYPLCLQNAPLILLSLQSSLYVAQMTFPSFQVKFLLKLTSANAKSNRDNWVAKASREDRSESLGRKVVVNIVSQIADRRADKVPKGFSTRASHKSLLVCLDDLKMISIR